MRPHAAERPDRLPANRGSTLQEGRRPAPITRYDVIGLNPNGPQGTITVLIAPIQITTPQQYRSWDGHHQQHLQEVANGCLICTHNQSRHDNSVLDNDPNAIFTLTARNRTGMHRYEFGSLEA